VRSAWIWSPRADGAAFGGPAIVALGLAALAPWLHLRGTLPPWGWLAFVLAVDVAHVHTTLFRTYFDRAERRRRATLYTLLPIAVYAAGVLLHASSPGLFWRVLAYVAVVHFVRQQVGWVSIYRARAGERDRAGRWFDHAVTYAATLYPIAFWHTHPRAFHWFDDDDFVVWPGLGLALPLLRCVHAGLLTAYAARELWRFRVHGFTSWGKHLVVFSTAALWYAGIVATNDDFTFTVTNVLGHGVPYMVLLWMFVRARGAAEDRTRASEGGGLELPSSFVAKVAAAGALAFLGVVLALAFAEEALWDRLVWHQRPWLFGGTASETPLLSPLFRTLVVPLLSVPQATHYVLDAVLWRRKDTGRAQAEALGFAEREPPLGAGTG
jgi:hypothetical protein